jgi:hypothetical protein
MTGLYVLVLSLNFALYCSPFTFDALRGDLTE